MGKKVIINFNIYFNPLINYVTKHNYKFNLILVEHAIFPKGNLF